jgi:preprotein translocase subunit SecE
MARTTPAQFVSQVRAEIGKVVWPTRREVAMTSLMVFLLAVVAALVFSLVDLVIRYGLTSVLKVFGS